MILANKQDLPNVMSGEEISRGIMSDAFLRDRHWCVFSVSATSGEGLYEALDWLTNIMAHNKFKTYLNGASAATESKVEKDHNQNVKQQEESKSSYFVDLVHSFKKILYRS